jgi:hypothetical protein
MFKLPEKISILGIPYKVIQCDNPADVDPERRKSLWGHINYWNREIRIFVKDKPAEESFHTLLHEIIHGICEHTYIKLPEGEEEKIIDIISLCLGDTLTSCGLVRTDGI